MKISGLQRTSLIDYPEHITTIVFTQGCNYKCPYCHNPSLIANSSPDESYLPLKDFWQFIDKRKELIDAVTITGGEPTLQKGLIDFIKDIKKNGLKIKLDSNGSNFKTLKRIIEANLVDYIAMDVKAPLDKHSKITKNLNTKEISKSINLIKDSTIDYEFRTTVVPSIHSKLDIKEIGKLISGAKRYYIQNFRPINTLDKKLKGVTPFPPAKLEEFKDIILPYVQEVQIRN
ncbi:anaerobic ribonucleoside-triphosphate reductase activating protein [Orenia marismortui]|uniref:anaerobic ribonucleoside-triphosphate reductase activating protein n=1 Tax=Orenia marismortui TaxID=46469 RepID=UPI000382092F|nr:anaerobic ribonucleoside-triphosphate reductase activating protein [Orenia marismortui]